MIAKKRQANQDDGEYGAGLYLEKLLINLQVYNKVIFVVRCASSKKIGGKRFEIMEEAVKQALAKIK